MSESPSNWPKAIEGAPVGSEPERIKVNEPTITQILIFHPDTGRSDTEEPFSDRRTLSDRERGMKRTASRQRHINLELERIQIEELATIRDIVLGTNNFVYAVVDYPASEWDNRWQT